MLSVSNDAVNMKSYCSRDPRRLSKRLGQKQLYLVVSIYLIIPSWIAGLTQQMEMKQHVFQSHQGHCLNLTLLIITQQSWKTIQRMYFLNVKNPIYKNILITCVKSPNIRVCLAHGKHKGLGELHHCLQKQSF